MGTRKTTNGRPTQAAPLRLEWRSPAELADNPRNGRRHPEAQVAALTDAMAEVGWAGALLFNERTGRLIDGHARRKVALAQGAETVPVLVGSWDFFQSQLGGIDPGHADLGHWRKALDYLDECFRNGLALRLKASDL